MCWPMPQFAASPGQERLAGRRDVPVMPTPTLVASASSRPARSLRQIAAERDRSEVVSVAEEDAAVVVVDQLAELVGDRGADLGDLEQAAELARDAVQHLEVSDRAHVVRAARTGVGTLALVLVEDDDPALAPCLGGHHRDLGAGDELARVRRVLGSERDPDREGHRPDRVELRVARRARRRARRAPGRSSRSPDRHDDRELLAADPADVVASGAPRRGAASASSARTWSPTACP